MFLGKVSLAKLLSLCKEPYKINTHAHTKLTFEIWFLVSSHKTRSHQKHTIRVKQLHGLHNDNLHGFNQLPQNQGLLSME